MVSLAIAYVPPTLLPVFGVIPLVFVFLWTLIAGDFKNFEESGKAYSQYSATDPVHCYTNYVKSQEENKKEKEN